MTDLLPVQNHSGKPLLFVLLITYHHLQPTCILFATTGAMGLGDLVISKDIFLSAHHFP